MEAALREMRVGQFVSGLITGTLEKGLSDVLERELPASGLAPKI
jgi:hypothetical protein